MRKIIYKIIVLAVIISSNNFAQWHLEPGSGNHNIWVKVDTCFFLSDYFNDFNDMAFIGEASGENFDGGMYVGYQLQTKQSDKWITITDTILYRYPRSSDGYIVVLDFGINVGRTASKYGNGEFRARIFAAAWNPMVEDTSDWCYTTVKDIIAPSTPDSIDGVWESHHPKITFSENHETDLKGYNIYKRIDNGPSVFLAFVTTNYYVDYSETQYSLGNDKKMVYYKVTAEDNTDNESAPTSEVRFVCNANVNKPNANGDSVEKFRLFQNYPNPFNPTTLISFSLAKQEYVKLEIYDILGQKVATVFEGVLGVGEHSINFDASSLSSGTYIYRISTKDFSAEKKMNVLK